MQIESIVTESLTCKMRIDYDLMWDAEEADVKVCAPHFGWRLAPGHVRQTDERDRMQMRREGDWGSAASEEGRLHPIPCAARGLRGGS